MKTTKTVIYALACISELAKKTGEFVQVSEIALAHNIPMAYCQKVLWKLSRSGFVESVKGKGFAMVRQSETIKTADIIKALGEHESPSVASGKMKTIEEFLSNRISSVLSNISVEEVFAELN